MIEWLNMNSGFIMALLTLVYVVATIVLARLQQKTLEEVKKDREEREKPNVHLQVRVQPSGLIMFGLINYGASPAESISVNFSDEFLLALPAKAKERLEPLKNAELYLAPKQEWLFGAMGIGSLKVDTLPLATATVKFHDLKGNPYEVLWKFDFSSHGSILLRTTGVDQMTYEMSKGLSKIENTLRNIAEKLK